MPAPPNSRRGRRRGRSGRAWARGQAEEKAGVWGGAGSRELAGLLPREARAVCASAAAGCPPGARKGIMSSCRPLPSPEETRVQKGPWQRPVPGRGPPVGSGVDSRLPPPLLPGEELLAHSSEDISRAGLSGLDTEGTSMDA